jgi:hypothetical protein
MAGRVDLADMPFRVFAALFLLCFALVCAPLLLTPVPPLVDYPNHLARMYLLAELGHTPALQPFYAVAWRPVPNLAMDALVPPLLRVLPLEWAGKLFLAATYFILAAGPAALNRVLFGRWSAWPCLAFLLIYNRLLLSGFLNFLFGLGLALCCFAVWIALRQRGPALRLAIGGVMAIAVYFAHLMAFGVYGALIVGYEAGLLWRARAGVRDVLRALFMAGLPFVPALALFLGYLFAVMDFVMPGEPVLYFSRPWRKFDLLFNVFDAYSRPIDVACFAFAVLGLGFAYWRRWLRLAPEIVAPFVFLGMIYLIMPSGLLSEYGADRRLPLVMALVLVGGSAWCLPAARTQRVFFGAAAALLLFRLAMVAISWQASGRIYAQILDGMDLLPRGARLAVAYPSTSFVATPVVQLPALAIARRDVFVPTLFAYALQQPIALKGDWLSWGGDISANRLWAHFIVDGTPLDPPTTTALPHYDYIAFAGDLPFTPRDGTGLQPIFVSPRFQIYRLPGS